MVRSTRGAASSSTAARRMPLSEIAALCKGGGRQAPLGWVISEASHESAGVRHARNLLVEGKISRKEFNKIQQADKNNQKNAQKKASAKKTVAKLPWNAPAGGSNQLKVNVLGKERIINVNVSDGSDIARCLQLD